MGNGLKRLVVVAVGCLTLGSALGCSKSSSSSGKPTAGSGGTGSGGDGSMPGGGASGAFVSTAGANNSGFPDDDGVYVGAATDVTSKLPTLPTLTNVIAQLNDDSTKITFDPFDGALDYRVYELPADGDIDAKADGSVVIKNGTYRCGGTRETASPQIDDGPPIQSDAAHTLVNNQEVGGYKRTLADATLGYVYTGPGPGLVPVYALGDADANADTTCYFARWGATRTKKYTTSKDERTQALSDSARDDGILFYVPSASSATTKQIYESTDGAGSSSASRYYFPEGPEADKHGTKTAAFIVESEGGPDRQPLMRVFYANQCGWSHDELAVGRERFNRIYKQGDTLPWWSLLWSGITGPTTLVVEALASGCPYQGHLSPEAIPSVTATFGDMHFVHEPFITLDDARAASATGEVFINGQAGPAWIWDASMLKNGMQPTSPAVPLPKAVARTYLKVKPNKHKDMDFFAAFAPGAKAEVFTPTPCDNAADCFASVRSVSATFDQMWTNTEPQPDNSPLASFGPVNGELWVTFADAGGDTNGKFRLTSKKKASMDATTFLHVTMEADVYSTGRRYPQILITDQDAPVQFRLFQGHSIIVQPRAAVGDPTDWPIDYQIELCKLRPWDVNNQCPVYDLHHIPGKNGGPDRLAPNPEVSELASADQRVLIDAYASTKRVYLFVDSKPYACAELPADAAPTGPVTVTWGDVLYHSAVDHVFKYHTAHLQIDTRRHFDNLGFSSGVAEPGWDESRFPCVAPIKL